MTQNINLIDEIALQPVSLFNSKLIIQIIAAWILLLIFIYALTPIVSLNKQNTLLELESKQKELLTQISIHNQAVVQFGDNVPASFKSMPFGATNFQGFYIYMEDLAKLTPSGVWLTKFTLSNTNEISIEGKSISSTGVSTMLNHLNSSLSFSGKKFDVVRLEKNKAQDNTEFTLGSIGPKQQNTDKKA